MITIDGFDDCVLGLCRSCSGEDVLLYDTELIFNKLYLNMSKDDALEHFETNILFAYVGENTPVFLIPNRDIIKDLRNF